MCSVKRTLDAGLGRDILLICLAVWVIGLSFGATAVASGLPLWLPVTLGMLVLAAGSEFLFIGVIGAGGNPIAALLTALLVNARHLPYGLSVPPELFGSGWRRIVRAHFLNDETVVLALAQPALDRKRTAYWWCGVGIMVGWPLGALMGGIAGSVVPDPAAFGLDAMFPAVLLALILPTLRERGPQASATRHGALAGVAIALATTPVLPAGLPVLLALAGLTLTARKGARQ
ncbi:AzlC family ABC transporter permease [Amycolatopsis cihanbeyliensis]|uniref:4-azaleucine resistance transporter AzlC n=1 Tax=Amycolatopsis cihanbeyliensis TaxID=1128664 RepID=A0A542DBK5_AMYCI|nr:AzlC family ABC transporter permease [Amycolatopsis cihanbeyliensis]TQJ00444.1 4-azaleucine resistance transporter AzlC [Amycolatopsis cihanbeyliensis]